MCYFLFCTRVFLIKVYTTQRTKCSLWSLECVFHGRPELKAHEKQIYVPLFCLFAGVSNNWTINWQTCAKQCSFNFCRNKRASSLIWGEQTKMSSLAMLVLKFTFFHSWYSNSSTNDWILKVSQCSFSKQQLPLKGLCSVWKQGNKYCHVFIPVMQICNINVNNQDLCSRM